MPESGAEKTIINLLSPTVLLFCRLKKALKSLSIKKKCVPLQPGKSYTASSL